MRLRETGTGREFYFANTHFDHRSVVARQEAIRWIDSFREVHPHRTPHEARTPACLRREASRKKNALRRVHSPNATLAPVGCSSHPTPGPETSALRLVTAGERFHWELKPAGSSKKAKATK